MSLSPMKLGRPSPQEEGRRRPTRASMGYAFRTLIWPRRRLVFLGLFLVLVSRLAGLIPPGATKYLVDDVIPNHDTTLLGRLMAIVGAAIIIQSVTSFLLTRLLSVEAQRLIADLRARIQTHVIHLPLGFFDRTQSGALVSRIMSDVEGVRNLIGTGLVQLLGGAVTAVVALIILLFINPLLTLFAVIPLALFGLLAMKAFDYIRPIFRERSVIRAEVTGRLTESLGGIRVIKGFNAESREHSAFAQGVDRLFQNVKRTLTTASLVTSSATLALGIGAVAIMGAGGWMIMEGRMTLGEFFAFNLYLAFLITPIVQMAGVGTQMTEAFAGLDRMQELLSETREGEEPGRTVELAGVEGDITFENVHFSYEADKEVLRDITFRAAPGTVTALVGSSGSGKTTLAGLAASFLTPERGWVRVDGIDLATVKLESYRRHLGVVLQDDFLFAGTIEENVRFANPRATDDALQHAVASAHVSEFTDRFEDGLGTVIGERGVRLSGGQRQRVAMARALLADPRVLILDEATSNLDTESERLIQESLATLMQGRTTFVIAHRLSTIRQADQILVVEAGEIVERGTHEELIAAEGRYYQLYTYQARI